MKIGDKVKLEGVITSKIESADGVEYTIRFDDAEWPSRDIRVKESKIVAKVEA